MLADNNVKYIIPVHILILFWWVVANEDILKVSEDIMPPEKPYNQEYIFQIRGKRFLLLCSLFGIIKIIDLMAAVNLTWIELPALQTAAMANQ